jgi:hypothetical protein
MFAGLPGIGVGTLFYVLMALWMPLREIPRVLQGRSSLAAWKLIVQQMFYASGIVVTVMVAEKVMLWLMGDSQIKPLSPATWLHSELGARATGSILAAPLAASFLLLGGVLLVVEVLRVIHGRLAVEPIDTVAIGDADRRRSPVEQPLEIG